MILIPTDFSASSSRALEVAEALARLRGVRICLLHVFEPPSVTIPEAGLDPQLEEVLQQRARRQLSLAAGTLRARGLEVDERLEVGSPPAGVIAEIAAQVQPELIVMGRHGRRAVPRLLLGSVADRVLRHVKQPVLVVPDATDQGRSLPGDRRWRIAVAIDRSDSSAAAVEWVRALRKNAACDLTFIHVYWPLAEYARYGLPGPRTAFDPDPATIQLLERSLAPLIGTMPGVGETTVRIVPNWGSTGERLIDEAARAHADLLVLGTHHRHGLARLWHGSTVPPTVHAATLPVLCVSQDDRTAQPLGIPRMRSVLAATDLSEFGNRAVAHAYSLVRGGGGSIHLVYVHERPLPYPAYAYAAGADGALSPAEESDVRARLTALVPTEAHSLGISTDITIIDGGIAAEVICQTAERLGVDAICLGSHGRAGLGRAMLGSVSAGVLHQSSRPVLVIRYPTG